MTPMITTMSHPVALTLPSLSPLLVNTFTLQYSLDEYLFLSPLTKETQHLLHDFRLPKIQTPFFLSSFLL